VAKDARRDLLGDLSDSIRNRARGERSKTLAPWALIGIAFTVLLILGFTQYRTLRLLEGQHVPETSSRMSTVLDLHTERAGSGSQWVVNWNQSSDVVRNSSRGRLSIRDGYVIKKEVELTKAELQSGRLFYTPLTDDVSFRLEVFDLERGKSTSEAIRVLAKVWSDGDLYGSELAAPRPQLTDLSGSRTTLQDLPRKIELRQQSSARTESAATADAERSTPPALKRFTPPAYRQPVVVSRSIDDAPDVPSTAGAAFLGLRSDSQMPALGAGIPPPPAPAAAGLARAVEKSDPIPATVKSSQSPPGSSDISSFREPKLLRRVDPKFPSGRTDLTGTVTVEATIGVDGMAHDLRLVSGSPLLGVAALQAIKEWRYSPALLNGRAIPAPTAIQVRFKPDPALGKR